MAKTAASAGDGDWVVDRLFGAEPAPTSTAPHLLDGEIADRPPGQGTGEIGHAPTGDAPAADVDAGAKRTAAWLGVGVVVASAAIVAAFTLGAGGSQPPPPGAAGSPRPAAAVSAAPRTSAATTASDQAIPFTASAPGCKAGSTSAQSLSDTAGESAWVCVRGTPEDQADGQVLHIEFSCDAARPASTCSYLVNAVSVTPGWVAKTAGAQDDWSAHRVVSRMQYNFYNGNELAEILTQDTGNVHGPAAADLRHPVLASHVVVIILQTSRPPTSPLPTGQPQSGPFDPGPGPSETTAPVSTSAISDPVDATFAVTAMQFVGHQPN